jgi:DNA-binding winged helix-turn-helix (wHTH) protein
LISKGIEAGKSLEPARIYTFGPFSLDTGNRSLSRDGDSLPLQPRAYEVLLTLIENGTRLVTRDEIMSAVWGADVNVEEGALNYQIRQLRSVLGDDAAHPQYIRTIPKQGFRFVASARVSRIEAPAGGVIGIHEQDGNAAVTKRMPDGDHSSVRPARLLSALQSSCSGHGWYVLGASTIYAAYFGVALLVEIAYQFDRYGQTGEWIGLLISILVLASSLLGLSMGTKRTSSGKRGGLLLSGAVFLVAAAIVLIAACGFLPDEPITQANFQTFTAQAAYVKDFCYIVPLGLIFLVAPLHFVVAMEQELRTRGSALALKLLTGAKPGTAPSGTVYLRVWFLLLVLTGMIAYSLIARAHLFDNLKSGPYMSLFQSLIHVRMVLYFGLAILSVTWYHRSLNDLKLESIANEKMSLPELVE